jgi:hypothetical protein
MPFSHQAIDVANGSQLREYAKEAGIPGRSKLKVNELRETLRAMLPPREGTSPPLFVELCAGVAALSLRLHQEGAKPPVSRMGSKRGFANAILHELGLYPGLRAEHYLWCEPDAGCRLLLEAYRDEKLAKAAAAIIRSWKDEEPRALWERLRAEGPVKCPPADPREVARWAVVGRWSVVAGDPSSNYSGPDIWDNPLAEAISAACDRTPTLPATITPDATQVDPREVARFGFLASAAFQKGFPFDSGYSPATGEERPAHPTGGRLPGVLEKLPPRLDTRLPTLPASISEDCTKGEPPTLPPGTVVYLDPPYVGTTGYTHALGREQVIQLALRWYKAGAMVAISEQEAIPELLALGWRGVDITSRRDGQMRTFSKQQSEFLTISPDSPC